MPAEPQPQTLMHNPPEQRVTPMSSRIIHPFGALVMLAMALTAAPARAAAPKAGAEIQARYQRELAACAAAGYVGDRQACRRDAGAARASPETRADDVDPGRYARNALKRCAPLPEADRADCMARMQGHGTTTGTTAAGAIYRELVTHTAGEPSAAASTPDK